MFLGKEINVEQALNFGLVSKICKPEGLNRVLKRTANSLLQKSHLALRIAKRLLNENIDKDMDGVLDSEMLAIMETGQSEEGKRRIGKFVKKE